ncbi:ubiquitin-conjugating enzyme E2 J1-like [Zophobas morio]|uniref:ubiquitin-conjugating enzyme E2 J1-like n=1 Tax=Zophobas morio TaxID=2755281 RepID=UPI0030826CD8
MPLCSHKSPSVKRVLKEASELREATDQYYAQPCEENIFEWHFTIRGPQDSPYQDGVYHGRILLPSEYPFKPPNIILLTPNGRFETGKKICLSISAYHPEFWRPSWSIRTVLIALISHFISDGKGSVGSLDYSEEERIILAKKSSTWKCESCGVENIRLIKPLDFSAPPKVCDEDKEAIAEIQFIGKDEADAANNPASILESSGPSQPTDDSALENDFYAMNQNICENNNCELAPQVCGVVAGAYVCSGEQKVCESGLRQRPTLLTTAHLVQPSPLPAQPSRVYSFNRCYACAEIALTLSIWLLFASLCLLVTRKFIL